MNQSNYNLDLLDSLFNKLNKKQIDYAILNEPEPLYKLLQRRDLDILINKKSKVEICSELITLISLFEMKIEKIIYRSYITQIYYSVKKENKIFQIDLITNLIYRFTSIKDTEKMLFNRKKMSNMYFVNQSDFLSYKKNRKLLIERFHFENNNYDLKFRKSIDYLFYCINNINSFKKILYLRAKFLFNIINFRKYPPIISVLGPDGTGKSTLIKEISSFYSLLGKNTREFYIFFGFFPRFRKTKNSFINKNPHGTIQRSTFIQYLKLIFYLSECLIFLICRNLNINSTSRKNEIFIFDRYPYDIYLDRIRYGFSKIPLFLLKFLLNLFTPNPYINIILKCSYNVAYKRKPELSEEEYNLISTNYAKAFQYSPINTFLFDTEILKPENIREIIANICKITNFSNR